MQRTLNLGDKAQQAYLNSMSYLLHTMKTGIQSGIYGPLLSIQDQFADNRNASEILENAADLLNLCDLIDLVKFLYIDASKEHIRSRMLKSKLFSNEKSDDCFKASLLSEIEFLNSNAMMTPIELEEIEPISNVNELVTDVFVTKLFNKTIIRNSLGILYGSTNIMGSSVVVSYSVHKKGFTLSAPQQGEFSRGAAEDSLGLLNSILIISEVGSIDFSSEAENNVIKFTFN